MAQVTDPIMLDATGQDIKDQISALNTKIQTLNTLLADLGLVSITPISQQDYDALSQAEKLAGVFDIYDAVEPNIDGTKVSYDNNTNVVQKIDKLQNKVTILAESTGSKTHAQHIAVLKAVWDTLSTDQRMKCLIKRANQIYMPTSIADTSGRFSAVEIDNQKVYIEMLRMSDTSFTILNGTTYTDVSNSTSNTSYTLYLPV